MFDTGAFITVISRREAYLRGFSDEYTIQANVPLAGFAGGCLTDIKSIPGIIIGNRRLEGVKVAVPHLDTDVNILGLNVIELLNLLLIQKMMRYTSHRILARTYQNRCVAARCT